MEVMKGGRQWRLMTTVSTHPRAIFVFKAEAGQTDSVLWIKRFIT